MDKMNQIFKSRDDGTDVLKYMSEFFKEVAIGSHSKIHSHDHLVTELVTRFVP